MKVSEKYHQSGCETGRRKSGRDGRKIEGKLSEVNTMALSGGQNEVIREFKTAVDVISIGIRLWSARIF